MIFVLHRGTQLWQKAAPNSNCAHETFLFFSLRCRHHDRQLRRSARATVLRVTLAVILLIVAAKIASEELHLSTSTVAALVGSVPH
jgi:hypothetical protein